MHYYKRNIGDYHKKAGRLNMLQHGAYSLLMDAIYDREEFPTKAEAIDWVWASTTEEVEAVEFVLSKFFSLEDGRYFQNRMNQELEEYTGICLTNSINGKKGGRPKGSRNKPKETDSVNKNTHSVNLKSELKPSESELKPNHKPLTTNQEPEIPPISPKGGNRSAIGIKQYLQDCVDSGVLPIPEDDTIFEYAEKAKIPIDFLHLCWREFESRNLENGKRYKDWRAAFRNCVRGDWYKIWWFDGNGECLLSKSGRQAQNVEGSG